MVRFQVDEVDNVKVRELGINIKNYQLKIIDLTQIGH